MTDTPKTLLEAVRYFSSPKVCFEDMLAVKWPDGKVTCPKCGGEQVGVVKSRLILQCKSIDCRKQFSVKVGTFAEDSAIPLGHWLFCVWLLANRISLSTSKIAELLGTYQRTAWHMMHKLRLAKEIAGTTKSGDRFQDSRGITT